MIDLCKMENHQIRAALVSEVRFGSSVAVLVPAPQRQALLTTLPRWELSSRASLEILGDLGGETATGIPFTARYSWQEGGAQLHNQEMELRTHGQARLVDAATQALQTFLVWFNQEHRLPHGRSLLSLELCSQDGSVRHSDYRSFIPIGADPVEEGPYRPVGLAKGVSKSLFANGLVGTETRKNHAVATLSLDDGKGRELSIPIQVVATLTHMITLNARSDWVEYPLVIAPDQVDTKGNDYVIDQFDVIAYDPISRTAFVTYKAASGTVVQVNLPPGVLLALRRSLEET
ncbi:MAG: hypothetical protein K8J08_05875 [Thermoanaerobaculia bacterium]|nr:hypothetical protein [Thermoanaerobaculia bacterium]